VDFSFSGETAASIFGVEVNGNWMWMDYVRRIGCVKPSSRPTLIKAVYVYLKNRNMMVSAVNDYSLIQ
jgi:hypothetical protein